MTENQKPRRVTRRLETWTIKHTRWFLIGVLLAGAGVALLVHEAAEFVSVIRVDLDDLLGIDLVGIGTLIIGLSALTKVLKNGYVERHHYEELERRVKGLEDVDESG